MNRNPYSGPLMGLLNEPKTCTLNPLIRKKSSYDSNNTNDDGKNYTNYYLWVGKQTGVPESFEDLVQTYTMKRK